MKKRTKKTISVATKVFTRLLLATILCAIVFVSMGFVTVGVFGDEVGYRVIDTEKGVYLEDMEYRYKAGESSAVRNELKLEEHLYAEPIMEAKASTQTVMNVIAQVIMLILLGIFPYNILWQFGNRDDTNVRYKGQRPDPWRGVKIGALAMLPFALFWVVLLAARGLGWNDFYSVYNLVSIPFIHYNTLVLGSFEVLSDVAFWRLFLLLPTLMYIPAVCAVSYRMGGHKFSLVEFLTFAKKKEDTEEEV